MTNLLLKNGADSNAKAKNGLAPIHLCSQEDRVNVAGASCHL
jgi:ankyrin